MTQRYVISSLFSNVFSANLIVFRYFCFSAIFNCLFICFIIYWRVRFRVMVFNATFNNISVISWWSVLLVEKTRVP